MKISDKIITKLKTDITSDCTQLIDENMERILKDLAEQIRSGGDKSIVLKIQIPITDDSVEKTLRAQTTFGWDRKVKVADAYMEHVIDCGPTLFSEKGGE